MSDQVMICGVDCHPGDDRCNGYCAGEVDTPPEATQEMVLSRKRKIAYKKLNEAIGAWHEYFCECEIGDERLRAAEVYERVRTADRIIPN